MSFRPFQAFRGFGGGALVDTDLAAFVAASGATDITVLSALTSYLKAQSLWPHCRIFPFKSAQNKGSGTTIYGLGGWTSNHITTVGGPTWGSAGMVFDAVDDRGSATMTGIEALAELYTFDIQAPVNASIANNVRLGVLTLSQNNSTFWLGWQGASGAIEGETITLGLTSATANSRKGAFQSWTAGQKLSLVWRHAAAGQIWRSKTEVTPYITAGNQDFRPSASGVTNSTLNVNADLFSGAPGSFAATTRVALLLCKTSLTTPQREAITDYLDAL